MLQTLLEGAGRWRGSTEQLDLVIQKASYLLQALLQGAGRWRRSTEWLVLNIYSLLGALRLISKDVKCKNMKEKKIK